MKRYEREWPRPLARLLLSVFVASAVLGLAIPASGSSHREAPLITTMPKVDATDLYVFRSYGPGRKAYVTFIANYIPLAEWLRWSELLPDGPGRHLHDPHQQRRVRQSEHDVRFAFQNTNLDTKLPVGGKQVSSARPTTSRSRPRPASRP